MPALPQVPARGQPLLRILRGRAHSSSARAEAGRAADGADPAASRTLTAQGPATSVEAFGSAEPAASRRGSAATSAPGCAQARSAGRATHACSCARARRSSGSRSDSCFSARSGARTCACARRGSGSRSNSCFSACSGSRSGARIGAGCCSRSSARARTCSKGGRCASSTAARPAGSCARAWGPGGPAGARRTAPCG